MSRRVLKVVAALTVPALMAASCSSDSKGSVFTGKVEDPSETSGGEGEPKTPGSVEATADVAVQEVERYWEEAFPDAYGQTFRAPDGYHAYSPDTPPPDCGEFSFTYEEMRDNAFYCHFDDFIAWDEAGLMPWLWDDFGGFTVAIVLAHEFGHAIQQRTGEIETEDSVVLEQQADCFAGAWTGWVAEGNSQEFDVAVGGLDRPIAGLLAFRDPPGTSPGDPGAHGAGFDRVRSFQEGFEQGAERCAEYPDLVRSGDLVITQIPFQQRDYETGGDLQLEDISEEEIGLYTLAEDNLEVFYEWLVDAYGREWAPVEDLEIVDPAQDEVSCGGETLSGEEDLKSVVAYCPEENVAVIDGATLAPDLWENIGDFAVASEIGRLWARAAQSQLGVEDLDDKQASLQADCWTGVWSRSMWPDFETGQVTEGMNGRLSAGDLDEVVMGFIAYRQARGDRFGNVFERTRAFRDGFQEGLNSCHTLNPLDIN